MNFRVSANLLLVTITISRSGYFVARDRMGRQSFAGVGEAVGTITETGGQGETLRRARLGVGYSMMSAGKFRRCIAFASAARFVWRAPGLPPVEPDAGCSRQ